MISKNKIKQIRSLAVKKFRQKEQLFLVEGDKNILELVGSDFRILELYATGNFIRSHLTLTENVENVIEASSAELKKASLLKQPQNCLALCLMPPPASLPGKLTGLSLYLDGVRDPGNLGTILRICDWFGIAFLFCSSDTADCFSPKVIQASMGSFSRVKVIYTPFEKLAAIATTSNMAVYATFLEGENIYNAELPTEALIILGNEGEGIRNEIAGETEQKLSIPSFSREAGGAESLNVAMAAAIICSEFRRRSIR